MNRQEFLFDNIQVTNGRHLHHENGAGEWETIRIPHDLLANAPLVEGENGGGPDQGFSSCFIDATYRTTFNISDAQDTYYLLADGIYRECEIYVNGRFAGGSPYGYIPMTLDITKFVQAGENLLEIYIDNTSRRCDRWYSGAGIYRRLSLLHTAKTHIPPHGVFITTPVIEKQKAEISVCCSLHEIQENTLISIELFAPNGASAGKIEKPLEKGCCNCDLSIDIKNPVLWSTKSPNLYQAEISLVSNGIETDKLLQSFGIRWIEFDAENGLRLNGENISLCGVNLHHDSGCVGSAFFPEVWRERLTELKKHGLNAVRVSHNPQASIFYDLCDELGLLVVDEIYDKWYSGSYDAHFWDCYKNDVRAFIERDRNHPCVIIWSVGNELSTQGLPEFYDPLDKLVAEVRLYDTTRPVSFGMQPHGWPKEIAALSTDEKAMITAEIYQHVDLLMCNYQEQWYERYHQKAPDACIIGSETYHWYTGIGDSSIGDQEVHPWNYVHRLPYVIGGFYWAGIDYRGESMCWPARGWTSSLFDIAGFARPQAMLSKAYWSEEPTVFVTVIDKNPPEKYERDGWSFPHSVAHTNLNYKNGDLAEVLVFTNCERVALLQDKTQCAEKQRLSKNDRWIRFEIQWNSEAEITAIGKNGGEEICRHTISRHADTEKIDLSVSKKQLTAAADDVAVVRVRLLDENGKLCATDDHIITVKLENLELLGIDNGDPASHHSYKQFTLSTFGGCCVLIVRGLNPGCGIVSVSAQGLKTQAIAEIMVTQR